jgi:hypothetical protein
LPISLSASFFSVPALGQHAKPEFEMNRRPNARPAISDGIAIIFGQQCVVESD